MRSILKKIQWERLDEVTLFVLSALLIVGLAFLGVKFPEKVPSEAWTITAVLVTAVARILKRNGEKSSTTEDGEEKPPVTT